MGFDVPADAYDRFMGRCSRPLAREFADFAGIRAGKALDVGSGPGALVDELRSRGATVTAIDPSPPFVAAVRERYPGVRALEGTAEALPFVDASFDASLAQLVVHFMADAPAGVAEMACVVRPGGTVAVCVWDHERGPSGPFWAAVAALGEAGIEAPPPRLGTRRGDLARLLAGAGLEGVVEAPIEAVVRVASFDEWWAPFELGVGPVGDLVARLGDAGLERLRERYRELLPAPPFELRALAWAARGTRA
ncbi:class I SAM-dependent methyltransferase [Agrococcus sp. TSP3-2-1]|uniref:class I SAM-dependent methyltransferase n=1 Tax=Agrococcus sp. TSP3-2-1 TaxID=2804583 RepID=UPI003CFA5A35